MGIGPAEVTFSWKDVSPARNRAMPAVEMQVNMEFEFRFMLSMRVGNRAAPSDMLGAAAIGCDGLPCGRLIEVGKKRSRAGERSSH